MWTYLIAIDSTIDPDELIETLNEYEYITNWYTPMSQAFVVVSLFTAEQLSDVIRLRFPGHRHIVLDTATDRNGWLPRLAWDLIKTQAG